LVVEDGPVRGIPADTLVCRAPVLTDASVEDVGVTVGGDVVGV
jgi:hypothetical protein